MQHANFPAKSIGSQIVNRLPEQTKPSLHPKPFRHLCLLSDMRILLIGWLKVKK